MSKRSKPSPAAEPAPGPDHRISTASNGAGGDPAAPTSDGRDPATGRFTAGNPGKAKGTRNRATLLFEVMRQGEDEMVLRDMVEEALAGNWQALKIMFRTLAPPRRTAAVLMDQLFDVEALTTSAEAAAAANRIPVLIANGVLTTSEGREFLDVLDRIEAKLRTAELQAAARARETKEAEQRRALLGLERQHRKEWLSSGAWRTEPPPTSPGRITPRPRDLKQAATQPPAPDSRAASSAAPDSGPPRSRPRDAAASSAAHS